MTKRLQRLVPTLPLLLAWALSVWRAFTVSLSFDEAASWLNFVNHPWRKLLEYSQTNHTLYSWILKAETEAFGPSQLMLRVPALVGTAVFLVCLHLICARLFPGVIARTLLVAFICLNPLMLELFCLARGYSMGLAFLSIALPRMLIDLDRQVAGVSWSRRIPGLIAGSFALGLSGTCHASFLPIGAGLGLGWLLLVLFLPTPTGPLPLGQFFGVVSCFAVPGVLAALGILRTQLEGIVRKQFYSGYDNPVDTLRDILNAELYRSETAVRNEFEVQPKPPVYVPGNATQAFLSRYSAALVCIAMGLLIVSVLVAGVFWLRKSERTAATSQARLSWLLAFTLGWEFTVFTLGYAIHGVPFPIDRYGIFLIPLTTLLWATVTFRWTWTRWLFVGVLTSFLVASLARWDPRFFRIWMFDAGARGFLAAVEHEHEQHPDRHYTIGGVWIYEPVYNFYRLSRHEEGWLSLFDNVGAPNGRQDFYLYHPSAPPRWDRRLYEPFLTDPISGTILLRRRD